ncbi:MAG: NAD(P)-dependent oxidoreductase, partial [Gemmatimonadaceae bacterium]|nr:NAD(P)-dependent oxidoreductase [Gemmatimonadaceae bacterium]
MPDASTSSRKRIFVTGATGVVGIRAVPLLISQGHHVTAVGRSAEKRARLESLGARAVELDVFDVAAARGALAGHDVVINLATHMPPSAMKMMLPWSWKENDHVRREGSAALARAAHESGVRRFIQESFAPVYEEGGDRWIDEHWSQRPAPYNATTLDAEQSAARFSEQGGEGVVLRFAGFYGPDAMLREMIGMVKKGWAPLPGAPNAYWSSIAHEDATTAVVDVPAGVYNVCDDAPLTRREWSEAFAAAVGAKVPRPMPRLLVALGGKSMELLSRSQRMSNAKLKAASGWTPKW